MTWGEEAYRRLADVARRTAREALGEIALAEGLLTVEQLDACLREQRESPEPRPALGELLVRKGYVTSEKLRYLLERQSDEAGLHDPLWRYEIQSLVARGGTASVFRAWDRRLRREVALKAVRSELAEVPEVARRILHEARAAAQLRHPHIVAMHDVCERGGSVCLVMDLVPGRTLAEEFAQGPPGRPGLIETLAKIGDAVHYAHGQGVVHRDLKPGNIVVDGAGEPRILDFGLARAAGLDSVQTKAGAVVGTPPYMAPEQVRGDLDAVGPRTDVYALGAILYEALAGRPPHQGETMESICHSVLHRDPVPPREIRPDVPAGLQAVALQALSKEPGDRYATAAEFAEDLRRYLRGESVRARGLSWGRRLLRRVRRRPVLFAGAVVSTAANAALIALALSLLRGGEEADPAGRLVALRTQAQALKETRRTGRLGDAEAGREATRLRRELESLSVPDAMKPDALYVAACISMAAGDRDGAERALRAALNLAARSKPARNLLAVILADRHFGRCLEDRGEESLADLKRCLEPLDARPSRGLFNTMEDGVHHRVAEILRLGWVEADRARAVAVLQELLRDYRAADYLNLLGRCQADPAKAVQLQTQALELAPHFVESLMDRAAARSLLGDTDGAMADYSEVLRLRPDAASAWANRGLIRFGRKNWADAAADLEKAVQLDARLRRHVESILASARDSR